MNDDLIRKLIGETDNDKIVRLEAEAAGERINVSLLEDELTTLRAENARLQRIVAAADEVVRCYNVIDEEWCDYDTVKHPEIFDVQNAIKAYDTAKAEQQRKGNEGWNTYISQ